jgi:hypothetical protein
VPGTLDRSRTGSRLAISGLSTSIEKALLDTVGLPSRARFFHREEKGYLLPDVCRVGCVKASAPVILRHRQHNADASICAMHFCAGQAELRSGADHIR